MIFSANLGLFWEINKNLHTDLAKYVVYLFNTYTITLCIILHICIYNNAYIIENSLIILNAAMIIKIEEYEVPFFHSTF